MQDSSSWRGCCDGQAVAKLTSPLRAQPKGTRKLQQGHHGHCGSQWKSLDPQRETDNSVLLAAQDDQIQPINDEIEGKDAIYKIR